MEINHVTEKQITENQTTENRINENQISENQRNEIKMDEREKKETEPTELKSSELKSSEITTSEPDAVEVGNAAGKTSGKKLGEKMKGLLDSLIQNVFMKYTVTVISVVLATLLASVLIDTGEMSQDTEDVLMRMMIFLWIFATATLTVEEYLNKKLVPKMIGFVAGVVYAGYFVFLTEYNESTIFGMDAEIFLGFAGIYYSLLIATLLIMSVYHMYRTSGLSLSQYSISAVANVAQTTIVYSLFAGGIAIVVAIFNVLIFDTDEFLVRLELFLAGGIFLPAQLLAISKVSDKVGKFMRGVVRNVLLPLLLAAFVIIYLYIFRILFSWELPSNEVFMILSFVFVLGMPIWTMAGHNKEKLLGKINAWLPVAFLPFILLQCICIGIRFYHYGYTPERYYACAFIAFEIIYVCLYLIKKGKYVHWIFPTACILLFVTFACPFVNADYLGVLAHRGVVEDALEKGLDNLTTNEAKELEDSYRVIFRECGAEGEKYLQSQLGVDAERLYDWYYDYEPINEEELLHGELFYCYANYDLYELEISEYNRIIRVCCDAGDGEEEVLENGSELVFIQWNQSENCWTVDLSEWLDNGIMYYVDSMPHDFKGYLSTNYIVEVNEQYDLFIENIYLQSYEDGYIEYVEIEGYLLEK